MTHRLYYTDSYLRDFAAAVVDRAEDGRRVYLDRTAFYPTSGGQPHDTGRLGGIAVLDVIDEERPHRAPAGRAAGRRSGRAARSIGSAGSTTCSSTPASIFSPPCSTSSSATPRSACISAGSASTLDLDTGALDHARLIEAEARANAVVTENREVSVSFEEAGRAEGLRKTSVREGTLRIVSIRELDRSACGGTHVRATGEIGPILITRLERVKKNVRLEFLCGGRAVRRARSDLDLLARVAGQLSAAPDELPALLESQRAELKASAAERRELEESLAALRARDIYGATPPDGAGIRTVLVHEPRGGIERLRPLAQAVTALPRALFVGWIGDPPALIVAASGDSELDAGRLLKSAVEQVGGRGGGNPRMAQGTAPSAAAVEEAIAAIAPGRG